MVFPVVFRNQQRQILPQNLSAIIAKDLFRLNIEKTDALMYIGNDDGVIDRFQDAFEDVHNVQFVHRGVRIYHVLSLEDTSSQLPTPEPGPENAAQPQTYQALPMKSIQPPLPPITEIRTMLQHTFIHLPGVGLAIERRWWQQGVLTWTDLLARLPGLVRGSPWRQQVQGILEASLARKHDARFFSERMKVAERWRLYGDFADQCAFLDIETTGGTDDWPDITVIGLYDGRHYRAFVQGIDLEQFEDAILDFQLVVTFNGARFDLPCIHRSFRNFNAPWVHIDLRTVLMRLGYRGGLKAIEQRLGIQRPSDLQGMNGSDAVVLWHRYLQGDHQALDTLIRYNREDVVNLRTLMDIAYRTHRRRLPLPSGD
ncbi:MAG TPA: hypothetical protein DCZ69_14380 [Syntrophobacteraceae bacterium]|nr:hypothetical protein [Syntrophobacteraceae bacterium]